MQDTGRYGQGVLNHYISCRVRLLHPSFSYGGSHAIITQADIGKEYYVLSNTKFVGPELFVGSMTVSSLIVLW